MNENGNGNTGKGGEKNKENAIWRVRGKEKEKENILMNGWGSKKKHEWQVKK